MNNAIETVAIAKMVKKGELDSSRDLLSAGEYEIDCLVHIQGIMKVGEDFEKRQTNKIDWIGLTALALSKLNGVTVESLIAEFEKSGVDGSIIKKQAQEKIDALRDSTMITSKGAVTTKLTYEIKEAEKIQVETETVKA